jgi:hypothetical protein
MKKHTIIFSFLFVVFGTINLFSQQIPVKVSAKLDSTQALIGDQVNLNINIEFIKDVTLNFPNISDSIGKLIILRKSAFDTTKSENFTRLSQNLLFTCFDSGYYQIPPIDFTYKVGNDTILYTVSSNSLYIKFFTVNVDTTKPIKDIKPPLEVPFTIWDYIWYILGFLLFIGIALGIIFLIYKRKPKIKEIVRFDPKIPAHVQALLDLEKLESEKLWQSGKVKEYHSRLTDILRLYLERRFSFPALESTTSDIIIQIRTFLSGSEILSNIKFVLELADLVKFAKNIPLPDENTRVMDLSRNIIESTIPIEIETEKGGNENG